MNRRKFCQMGLGVSALSLLSARITSAASDNQELLTPLQGLAEAYLSAPATPADEELYVAELAQATRDKRFNVPTLYSHPWSETPGAINGASEGQSPLVLYFVSMRQGALLPVHTHLEHLSLLRVLSGKFRIERFTQNTEGAMFSLHKVDDCELRAGNTSVITSRVCFHQITALEDSLFVDVITNTGAYPRSLRANCREDEPFRNCRLVR